MLDLSSPFEFGVFSFIVLGVFVGAVLLDKLWTRKNTPIEGEWRTWREGNTQIITNDPNVQPPAGVGAAPVHNAPTEHQIDVLRKHGAVKTRNADGSERWYSKSLVHPDEK